jgi:hypothetical protein
VNRPFYAFGALLVLLALAMLAVGSADRSTTDREPPSPSHRAEVEVAGRGAIYVVVLPAANDADVSYEASAATEPSYATGCGLDRLTGEVYGCEPCFADCGEACYYGAADCGLSRGMAPAQIELAKYNAVRLARPEAVDCRSHYDPVYDLAVYGGIPTGRPLSDDLPAVCWSEIELERVLAVFQTIVPRSAGPAWTQSPALRSERSATKSIRSSWLNPLDEILRQLRRRPAIRQLQNARTILLGLQNYAARLARGGQWLRRWTHAAESENSVSQAASIDWSDYFELIGETHPLAPVRPASQPSNGSVRSSRWLLHFAASSLNQAAVWLQEAAVELERAGTSLEARQPGGVAR